jgi:hypothetical protein
MRIAGRSINHHDAWVDASGVGATFHSNQA